MKKLIILSVIFSLLFSVQVAAADLTLEGFEAYSAADSTLTDDIFNVTNGITKDYESTFDPSRTISGFSLKDTEITVLLYVPEEDAGGLSLTDTYGVSVGSSGIFSQTLELYPGENYILVFASNTEGEALRKIVINRKNDEIKLELEQNIAFPGSSLSD